MKKLLFSLMLVGLLVSAICASQSMAAVFHVTNATEFEDAINTTENNGKDDTIYLAAGTYTGSFSYHPAETEHKSLTIAGEPGTNSSQIILDGQNLDGVLTFYDDTSAGPIADITVRGITIQKGLGSGGASGLRMRFLGGDRNISIVDCIIKENSGEGFGAGIVIEADGAGNVLLESNLIINNTVTERSDGDCNGGGIAIWYGGTGEVTVRNNIIANNSASGTDSRGGGLWIQEGIVHLIGNTIYNNQANQGGGVYFISVNAANVYNNIIYGNTATEGGDIHFENPTTANGYNNNYSSLHGTWTGSGNNLNTDPLFVDSGNNDFHLLPTSPMINAGTTAVPDPPRLPTTDFEGSSRVIGTAPDIGAYEWYRVSPSEGTIGTEITITGSENGIGKGKMLIGTSSLKILEWTGDSIRSLLSKALPPDTYDLTIRPKTKGSSPIIIANGFTVKPPEIETVEPTSGSIGDEITINGLFFGTKKGKVTLGGKTCKVLKWEMNSTTGESEIQFVVPKGLDPGTHDLTVTTTKVGSDTVDFTVE